MHFRLTQTEREHALACQGMWVPGEGLPGMQKVRCSLPHEVVPRLKRHGAALAVSTCQLSHAAWVILCYLMALTGARQCQGAATGVVPCRRGPIPPALCRVQIALAAKQSIANRHFASSMLLLGTQADASSSAHCALSWGLWHGPPISRLALLARKQLSTLVT